MKKTFVARLLEINKELWLILSIILFAAVINFFVSGQRLVLTNGFAKKTQKTPGREIALAEQRKREHSNRKLSG